MSGRGNNSHRYRGGGGGGGGGRGWRGGRGAGSRGGYRGKIKTVTAGSLLPTDGLSNNEKFEAARLASQIDEAMGFQRYESGSKKVGWLVNMHTVRYVALLVLTWRS